MTFMASVVKLSLISSSFPIRFILCKILSKETISSCPFRLVTFISFSVISGGSINDVVVIGEVIQMYLSILFYGIFIYVVCRTIKNIGVHMRRMWCVCTPYAPARIFFICMFFYFYGYTQFSSGL